MLAALGGRSVVDNVTFSNCLSADTWNFLSIILDKSTSKLSVFVNTTICGSAQSVTSALIDAHTDIIVGKEERQLLPTPSYFKGKMSCFSVFSKVHDASDMTSVMADCQTVLRYGQVKDGIIYKPELLRLFLPMGKAYGTKDVSGNNMHGQARGRVGTSTGPLGHPYSATKFYHEPRSGIEVEVQGGENSWSVATNDSVTYMGYISVHANRDGNLPYGIQMIFEHYETKSAHHSFGAHFMFSEARQIYYNLAYRGRYRYVNPTFPTNMNMWEWRWFVAKYSRTTRRFTVSIDGVTINDVNYGYLFTNFYSSMSIGYRWHDDNYRFTGKMSCFMIYDADMDEHDQAKAKEMCHSSLIRAYGEPMDESKCRHTEGGWEYKGKMQITENGRLCKKWTESTDYRNPAFFPDDTADEAENFCRNPEPDSSIRSRPWCFTHDPTVPWEYCDVPLCERRLHYPIHKPKYNLGYWPMGQTFRGADVSGHDHNAGVGADTAFVTGPAVPGKSTTASFLQTGSSGHYWVRYDGYNNVVDSLDIGKRKEWVNGSTYSIWAKAGSYSNTGSIWSWESSNGDGGTQGVWFRFTSTTQLGVYTIAYYGANGARWHYCNNLVSGQWYMFSLVHDIVDREIRIYKDHELCSTFRFDDVGQAYYDQGLYTYPGSFKFGRSMNNVGSNIAIACATIYLKPLKINELMVVRQKCLDALSGVHNDILLEPLKPVALWPMSAHTEGFNSRGPNHAFVSMVEPTVSMNGVQQGAYAFPGNNMQNFWSFQNNIGNLDVCRESRSFTMSSWAYIENTGTAFSMGSSSYGSYYMTSTYDDYNRIGRGNTMSFKNTQNDLYFYMQDSSSYNPTKTNVLTTPGWAHVTTSYDYLGDNFQMFVNGTMVYQQIGIRGTLCQTSGSVSLGKTAVNPMTLSYPSNPFRGSLQCAQLYSRGFITEGAVARAQRYCSHPDFIGCYPTAPGQFKVNPGFWSAMNLTVEDCRKHCGKESFEYAALKNGDTCLCTDSYGKDGPETPEMCDIKCLGNSNDWCGGEKHVSIYRSSRTRVATKAKLLNIDYASCPYGWHLRAGNCYKVFMDRKNMEDSMATCKTYGAQLATVNDYDENKYLAAISANTMLPSDYICLGVNETTGGQYRGENMDGSKLFFANWASSQPSYSNYWGCMLMSNLQWYSQAPSVLLYFACKKSALPYTDFTESSICKPGWTRYGNDCLFVNEEKATFAQAKETCQNYEPHGYLAKITSYDMLLKLVNSTDLQQSFWIGIEYSNADGSDGGFYQWTKDNSRVDQGFQLWAGDNFGNPRYRRCGYADSWTQYSWRTTECEYRKLAFACQYSLEKEDNGHLGLISGKIQTFQLRALDSSNTSVADMGRLNNVEGSFCTEADTVPGAAFEIDLRSLYNLTTILIQGNPLEAEWTTQISLDYTNDKGVTWQTISGLTANSDQNTIQNISLTPEITADRIRIIPTAFQVRPCFRVELVGRLADPSVEPKIDIAFQPIHYEFSHEQGRSVRYNASLWSIGTDMRFKERGVTRRITGKTDVVRSPLISKQQVRFEGIDAEGSSIVLKHDINTGSRLERIELNMCPIAVLFGTYAACEVRLVGGTDVKVTTDYGFNIQGPRTMKATEWEIGTLEPPTSTESIDTNSYIYMALNQAAKKNGTVRAIEVELTTAGWITIQMYRPYCNVGLVFCPISFSCIEPSVSCKHQQPYDGYSCDPGNGKGPKNKQCTTIGSDSEQLMNGDLTSVNPPVDFEFVTEWRKHFPVAGRQVIYLNESEVIEATLGNVFAYYRNSDDDGRITTWANSYVKEYMFMDSTSGFSDRKTSGFIVPKSSPIFTTVTHMIKLHGVSSIGISFGRKWKDVIAGRQHITITARDLVYPDNVVEFKTKIEVQHRCLGYQINFPAIADAANFIPFTVPEHNGTECHYEIDFGDRTTPTVFDYTTRNSTYYHVYKLDGQYNVTLRVWNLVYESSIYETITVVFPIERMSAYVPNQPAHQTNHYSAAVMTYAQASSAYSIVDLNSDGVQPMGLTRSFSFCPAGWMAASSLISDSCYRYFYTYNLAHHDADHFCASIGAKLFTVTTESEMEFVKKNVMNNGPTDKGAWTGFNQMRDHSDFWVPLEDKDSLGNPFWQEISGLYPVSGAGKCIYYDYASRRMQNDDCSVLRPFVCKRESAVSSFCGPNSGWTYHPESNRCFKAFTTKSTFLTATVACKQTGGQLAVPDNENSMNYIFEIMQLANPTLNYYLAMWRPSGTNWKMSDNGNLYTPTYTNYATGQPTSATGENCMVAMTDGKWRSVTCTEMSGYVCEKQISGSKASRYVVRTAGRRYVPNWKLPPACPLGWKVNNETGICFKLFTNDQTTWTAANDRCLTYNSHLAVVNTVQDQTWMFDNVIGTAGVDVWIGAYETASGSNVWRWSDNSDPTTFSPSWATGQPTGAFNGFIYMGTNTRYMLKSDGTSNKAYVCSKPAIFNSTKWAGSCPTNYKAINGKCYRFHSSAATFATALTNCKNDGAGLATITSEDEFIGLRGFIPYIYDDIWVGLQYSGSWKWAANVRDRSPAVSYTGMWAPGQPAANTGCGVMARSTHKRLIQVSCSNSYGYICEQPAILCPPNWKMWGGSCYQSFNTPLLVQPGTEYDIAGSVCRFEGALLVSPTNTQEYDMIVSMAGGQTFLFGHRRLGTSLGFIDLSGRRSYFYSDGSKPTSGNYYAYYTGSGIGYTSSFTTATSICSRPCKYFFYFLLNFYIFFLL